MLLYSLFPFNIGLWCVACLCNLWGPEHSIGKWLVEQTVVLQSNDNVNCHKSTVLLEIRLWLIEMFKNKNNYTNIWHSTMLLVMYVYIL